MDAGHEQKAPIWPETSKIPCYFPCSQGISEDRPHLRSLAPGARLARKPVLPLRQAARTTHSRASRAARSAPPLRPSGVEAGQSSAPTFHHDTAHRLHLLSCNLTIAYSKSCQSLTIHQVTPGHGQSDASSSWPTYHSSC